MMLRGVVDKPDAADDASPPQQRTGVGAVYRGLGMARVLRKSVRILAQRSTQMHLNREPTQEVATSLCVGLTAGGRMGHQPLRL